MRLQSLLIYLFFKSEAIPPHCKMKAKGSKDDILTPTSTFQTVHLQCEHDEAEKTARCWRLQAQWHRGKDRRENWRKNKFKSKCEGPHWEWPAWRMGAWVNTLGKTSQVWLKGFNCAKGQNNVLNWLKRRFYQIRFLVDGTTLHGEYILAEILHFLIKVVYESALLRVVSIELSKRWVRMKGLPQYLRGRRGNENLTPDLSLFSFIYLVAFSPNLLCTKGLQEASVQR